MAGKNEILASSDREIVISRVFDAPRELVWNAMTDPHQVINWWGPNGFTTTVHEMDLRPGGQWLLTMHGPDGTDYPNESVFVEIVKPERLVYSHGGSRKGGPAANFVATWTFELEGNKTRLTMRMVFDTAAERDLIVKEYGAVEGGKQTLARLSLHLAKLLKVGTEATGADFVLTRVFDAPRELVFKAWTDPRQMARWWGPKVMTNPVCEMDVRPGGTLRIVMRSPEGVEYPFKGVYLDVVEPEKLVYTNDCSEHPDEWHAMIDPKRLEGAGKPKYEATTTVTFEDIKGQTKLTIRMSFDDLAIRDKMIKLGMNEGWSQSLESLVEILANTGKPS